MKQRSRVNLIFILSVLLMLVLISTPFMLGKINRTISNCPDVVKAQADFTNVKTQKNRSLYLSGEWLYFDGHIITENALLNSSYVQIPPTLSSLSTSDESNGCHCSYAMSITGLDLNNAILYIPNFAGVYQVFINGGLVAQSGSFNDSKINANLEINAIPFNFESDKKYEVVIEVSCDFMPGIYMTPVISD